MKTYIRIDASGYVEGWSRSENLTDSNMIEVTGLDIANGKMWNGTAWVPDDRTPVTAIRGITKDEFRKRFSTTTLMKLDKLEVYLEDDAVFDAICINVAAVDRDLYRDGMRTAYKNLYSDTLIYIDQPEAITGVTLFSDAGVITVAEKDAVLDTSTL